MAAPLRRWLCLWLLAGAGLAATWTAQGQLVADGNAYTLDGVVTNVTGGITVGTNGGFTFLMLTNSAAVANTGDTIIGSTATAKNNSVVITGSGSAWQSPGDFYVGNQGSGNSLSVLEGAMVSTRFARIGNLSAANSNSVTVSGAGSVWVNSWASVGQAASSNWLTVANGGALLSAGDSNIGASANFNTALITDPQSLWTNLTLAIGSAGISNLLVISNAATVVNGSTSIGVNSGSGLGANAVLVTGTGSLLTNSGDLRLASLANRLSVLEGGRVVNAAAYLGYSVPGSSNSVLIAGTDSMWSNRLDLYVGYNGQRTLLVVSNAGTVNNNYGYIGYNSFSVSNLVVVTDPGSSWSNRLDLVLGYDGAGNQLVVSNAGVVAAKDLIVGYDSTAINNTLTLAGGSLFATNAGSGMVDVRRGTLIVNSGLLRTDVLQASTGSSGKIVFNGGTLQASHVWMDNGLAFVIGDGTHSAGYEMSPGLHLLPKGLTVSSNASLTGSGTIIGNVSVGSGGTVSPGSSNTLASITLGAGATLSNGSTTQMKLRAASGTCDSFTGATNVTFGGTLQLTNMSGLLGNGSSFQLFSAAHFTGAFAALSPASPGPDLRWNTNQLNVDGTLRVFSIPTPAPVLTGASVASGTMAIAASGGIPYDPCYLLTSTNAASPLTQWLPCATNHFDAAGNVSLTQAVALDDPQRFYRLSVE